MEMEQKIKQDMDAIQKGGLLTDDGKELVETLRQYTVSLEDTTDAAQLFLLIAVILDWKPSEFMEALTILNTAITIQNGQA